MNYFKKIMNGQDSKKQHKLTSCVLMSPNSNNLPKQYSHSDPVKPLNAVRKGFPIFFMDLECSDLSHLQRIAKNLDRPAYALLYCKNTPVSNAEGLATYYLEKIKDIPHKNGSDVVAFSCSIVPAFEMFLKNLKSHQIFHSLTIISGLTHLVKVAGKEKSTTESILDIICEFVEMYIPVAMEKLKENLSNAANFAHQIEIVVDEISKARPDVVSKTELFEIVTFHLKMRLLLETYKPKLKLPLDILVIEDSTDLSQNDVAETHHLLSQICTGKISIQTIPGMKNFEEGSLKKFVTLLQNHI